MELPLATPALLFPAISLILLAYTNRFLALAALIRNLHERWQDTGDPKIRAQIRNLRLRVTLIRVMQSLGVGSILLCVLSIFALFQGWRIAGASIFAVSLVAFAGSLIVSLTEIQVSVVALDIQLADMECEPPAAGKATTDKGTGDTEPNNLP